MTDVALSCAATWHPGPGWPTTTGALTWIWSVVVDEHLDVRAYNGVNGCWYKSAIAQRAGKIPAAGGQYEVEFTPVHDEAR